MEDARYRARHVAGPNFSVSESNLVSGSAGDVLWTEIIRHQAVRLCVFGLDSNSGISAVAAGNEATLGLYKLPKEGAAAEVDLGIRLVIPAAGVAARGQVRVECKTNTTDLNAPAGWPILEAGDRLRIKLVDPGAVTAQAGRPFVHYSEYKGGDRSQEGPS